MTRRLLTFLALTLALLAGCTQDGFKDTDITGVEYARDFHLTDQTGRPRSLADFKGKVVSIFFGYTQCPDVCPTTMADMHTVLQKLGPADAAKVQVLFVTVDPERDTQALLSQYVPAFDPSFIGLRGDLAATAQTAKDFKVFYEKVPGKTPGSYSMNHTAGSYVYDPQGRLRLFVQHTGPSDDAKVSIERQVHDIKLLLAGK
ncbi:MAG TPA: SCO family protein [Burkholderiales bacterium]|nr:SCO family protein [Burkholderiales bacterium]